MSEVKESSAYIEYEQIEDDKNYQLKILCRDCNSELNSTKTMSGEELKRHWGQLVTSSALVSESCKSGCRSTFSDCNINTDLKIKPIDS